MKVLPTARILLVDSQMERRQATRLALAALGVGAVSEAASVDEVADPAVHGLADVLVVQVDDPQDAPANPFRFGAGIPAVLIAEVPAQLLVRAAGRAGYDAALGAPLAPRLLYRRIGSVLQRARRLARPASAATVQPADLATAD
ncbi:hypothetical protein EZH22_25430 [Xanthobacter dioxanivorans]|uniref:Response regulatory domain-containing protein n=1 Tax=Xanthobacter dioxanivorans TaxID=2528964 RepID=A0A974SHG6_9HYPH|nr:hypothetical protein [Xanthobacter dioxanivorans]QRG06266.1 hypothetical protein EZH22_25430 [Xanthobacter dioxanivorans]